MDQDFELEVTSHNNSSYGVCDETNRIGTPHAVFVNEPHAKICRMNFSQKKGNIAILDFHFLIATKKGIGFLRDKHELGLFEVSKFLNVLKKNGFSPHFLKNGLLKGRGLYLAVKE